MSALQFFEKSHRYKLDGQWVPGVTTVISKGLPKPALTYWSARTVAEFVADNPDDVERLRQMGRGPMVAALKETPWQKRDEAAVRGTDVHLLGQQLVHGVEVDVPEHLAGHVESYVRFLDECQPKPMLVEFSVFNRSHWWAGTADLLAQLPDGRWILADLKTSSGIYPETALQLSAYRHAEFYVSPDGEDISMPGVDECWAIWVRADGFDVIPVRADDYVYSRFRHVAVVAKTAEEMKHWVQEPLSSFVAQEVPA